MSDWLSEIENYATLALEGDEAFVGEYMDELRMARVIRELAEVIERANANCDCSYLTDLIQNLPPDAKELLK